jgi:hypothetical protein
MFILTFFLVHGIAASLALEAEFPFTLCTLLLVVDLHGLDCIALGFVDASFEDHGVLFWCVVFFQSLSERCFNALPNFHIIL